MSIFMSMFSMRKGRNRMSGFTLIELLVVIAIIGVLASIVLASLNSARKKSRDARRITDIKQIQLALELYFDSQGSTYPPSGACDATHSFGLEVLATNNYIPQVSRDPSNTAKCYAYGAPTTAPRVTYHLGASLEEASNPALAGDKNQAATSGWLNDFNGANVSGTPCIAGDPGLVCYDIVP